MFSLISSLLSSLLILEILSPNSGFSCRSGSCNYTAVEQISGMQVAGLDKCQEGHNTKVLNTCTTLVNLICQHKSRRYPDRPAYFHIIIDCMVPLYGSIDELLRLNQAIQDDDIGRNISKDIRNCILVDDIAERLVDQLRLPKIAKIKYQSDVTYCIKEETALIYDYSGKSYKLRNYEEERLFTKWMRGNLTSMMPPPSSQTVKILVTNRQKLRTIQNFDSFVDKLSTIFGRENVTTYDERTTFEQMIKIFSSHNVFIHFHGAAGANSVFMPANSLVLEISTFLGYESDTQWRSNARVSRVNENLTWIVYSVPLSQVNIEKGEVLKAQSRNQLLHYMPSLYLTTFDMSNIINVIVGTKCQFPYDNNVRKRVHTY